MTRRKQYLPRKHDGAEEGTNSEMGEQAAATVPTPSSLDQHQPDDEEIDLPLDCSKSSKSSTPSSSASIDGQPIDMTAAAGGSNGHEQEEDDGGDCVLDLSTRKRPRSPASNESASDLSIKRTNRSASPKAISKLDNKDKETPPFSSSQLPSAAAVSLLNFANGASGGDFLSSALSSTNPFASLCMPPFRFPPFVGGPPATAAPQLTSPPPAAALVISTATPSSSSSTTTTTSSSTNPADALSRLSSLVYQVGKGHKPPSVILGGSGDSKTSLDQLTAGIIGGAGAGNGNEMLGVEGGSGGGGGSGVGGLQEALGAAAGHGLSFQELWLRFVKKEENAELKRLNEAKQIFTCLQCHASFQTMEQLVKHMETTQHYANIPKHYSWSLQYARQRMRQMKMKMKYSDKMMYYCFLCSAPFSEPVHIHFNCAHNMHNPVENMKFVHVISVNGKNPSTATTGRSVSSASSSSTHHQHPTSHPKRTGGATTPITSPPLLSSTNGVDGHHHHRRRPSQDDEVRFSSSPLSASSCGGESGTTSVSSPSPSTSSKRSVVRPSGASYSPSSTTTTTGAAGVGQIDKSSLITAAYTDNLLLKMEELVQTAAGENADH